MVPERVEIVHEDPLCVEIDADLERAGVVVLADLWYPGWELTVHSDAASRRARFCAESRDAWGRVAGGPSPARVSVPSDERVSARRSAALPWRDFAPRP